MALYPGSIQKPVSAHGGPMGTVLGCVIHVSAGEGDPYNEFANPNNQVSSHFGIGNGQGGMADGLVEQYVDTGFTSWAQAAGNGNYLSVETEGEPTEPLTPAQVVSFGHLLGWMSATHGFPLGLTDTPGTKGFITHGDGGAAWGGHTGCPGPLRSAQRPAILAIAGNAPPPHPVPTQEQMMNAVVDTKGVVRVYAANPQGHLLEFSPNLADPAGWSVIDITASIESKHGGHYEVQP